MQSPCTIAKVQAVAFRFHYKLYAYEYEYEPICQGNYNQEYLGDFDGVLLAVF